ncbi:hypothetical protein [Nucisporomicrobium flavum]|uniref:hypothetical protein n=1 Tax=Nucisporomicrobium flavum TaxID=2785915 RepID=UPI0018F64404|nr:hypothetical protein [Nucisporomicrobium flavum]
MTTEQPARRFYRLRAPGTGGEQTAVSVRVDTERDDPFPVYLAVGAGRRRMHLTDAEAWTLWRCLSEAVASLGDPPDYIRTNLRPSGR